MKNKWLKRNRTNAGIQRAAAYGAKRSQRAVLKSFRLKRKSSRMLDLSKIDSLAIAMIISATAGVLLLIFVRFMVWLKEGE